MTIVVLPTDDGLYKVAGDLGFESWFWGLDINLPVHQIQQLRFRHQGRGGMSLTEYDANAIAAFVEQGQSEVTRLRNLHCSLPSELGVDSMVVTVRASDRGEIRRSVPIRRYRQRGRYRIPLEGCWFVSSGHDFGVEHRRHLSRGHFAWDLQRVDGNGRVASGPGLERNFSFGQKVLAPAAGRVVQVVDHYPDNPVGITAARANFVVIDHENGEYSKLGHLKRGSSLVEVGQRVRRGQPLGLVGNSGMSDVPHLHLAFQTRPERDRSRERPLPVQLAGYRVSWNQGTDLAVDQGRPRRGQFVCHDETLWKQ